MNHPYDDIINLPHHVSERHPQMSMYNRAAQFAPFAALTGHDSAITEAARLTEAEEELSESDAEVLNRKLAYLQSLDEKPTISVTYFVRGWKLSYGDRDCQECRAGQRGSTVRGWHGYSCHPY